MDVNGHARTVMDAIVILDLGENACHADSPWIGNFACSQKCGPFSLQPSALSPQPLISLPATETDSNENPVQNP